MHQTILELLDIQSEIGEILGREYSDAEFASTYLPFSATSWSRLKNNQYGADPTRLLQRATTALEDIPARVEALRKSRQKESSFIRTSIVRAVLSSILAARDSSDRRIVPVLAPTGYGKTRISEYLADRGAIVLRGRQAWQMSYRAFCSDICDALGPAMPVGVTESHAESEMIRRLKNRGGAVLYIDEANAIGAGFANGLKQIHNETQITIVVAAVPALWDRFVGRNVEEVRQVINRCQPVIRATRMPTRDAAPFLASCGLSDDEIGCIVQDAANVANVFGGFKTLIQIRDTLAEIDNPTLDDARAAIESSRRNVIAAGLSTNN